MVGAIFDKVYLNANPKNVMHGMQTVLVEPGDGFCVELTFDEPGPYGRSITPSVMRRTARSH